MQIAVNNTARPLIVAKPQASRNGLTQHIAVRLMPGSNEVDDDTAKVLSDSATARHWVEKKWLTINESKKAGGEGLDGFEPSAAIVFVQDCMDVATLDRWEETEKRKDVKAAIKKRSRELQRALDHETRAAEQA